MLRDLQFHQLLLLHSTCLFSRLGYCFELPYVFLVMLHLNEVHEPAKLVLLARHKPSKKLPLVLSLDLFVQDVVVFLVTEVR